MSTCRRLSWDDIRPKLVTALVAGTAPADVTEFDWSWTGQFAAADWYMPLNDVIDADSVKDIGVAKIFTVDGKLLGMPYTNDFRVMLINKKHFADAGVTEMPKTLDQLVAAAKQIKEKGIATYPIGLPVSATEGASTSWYLLTKAFGGELFDKDFNPLFTKPDSAGYKALAFELMLLKEGLVDPASTGLKDSQINEGMFSQGPHQHHDLGRARPSRTDERPQAVEGRRPGRSDPGADRKRRNPQLRPA
jgi:multiple sugar transport system substrate-binding protein